ncbi:DUF2264 domain-containing protein [Avibacterium sp. 21-594]|uniref:DUF2264 domain-containing protein n=1 Tax=Avibacterium sp. 21-594 TaxID=2911535 RepID=UPI002247DD52|nr:DUF2264 domain-containing protein [Avibacterium sp. 21-594]MCW9716204.1 DUF2264 domain-containing protein [Avibacterium sp. 21-594]
MTTDPKIRFTERPYLAHEHPQFQDYWRAFKERLQRSIKRKACFSKTDPLIDKQLKQAFTQDSTFSQEKFELLVEYFIRSFFHYANDDYARADYHGYPSEQGMVSDSIEGAARNYPLLAAYLHYQSDPSHPLFQQVQQALSTGFLNATNPNHSGYWGKLKSFQQTICESADFALALWLSKAHIWQHYNASQQQQIIDWLRQINHVQTVDNNWHLFILLVQLVVKDLAGIDEINQERYQRIKEFYVGNGWFRDGEKGNFDYYNSWGFHYGLFWLDQIAPDFDRTFIQQSAVQFCQDFHYLFAPQGFAFFGRSLPYRFAAPTALISTMIQQEKTNGQGKRILSQLTHFFIQQHAIQQGNVTQGLFETDRRLVDPYSGAASGLWSLRPFILLLYAGQKIHFWQTAEQPLAIEKQDYDIQIPAINLRIIGTQATQEIIAQFQHQQYPNLPFQQACLQQQNGRMKIIEWLCGRSTRGKNNLLRKGVTTFSSKLSLYLSNKEKK